MTRGTGDEKPQKVAFATANFRAISKWLDGSSTYGGNIFGYLEDMEDPDWLVVYHDVDKPIKTRVPRERRIAILAEPPEILRYKLKFAEQFGVVLGVSCPKGYSGTRHRTHIAHPSFYGINFSGTSGATTRYSFSELLNLPRLEKKRKLTAVLSRKTQTPMHRKRLELAERLKAALGDDFLIFGRGFTPIDDKAEAIDDYKYHLALENCAHADHWTEKLSDPLIGWSLPIYAGCPNLSNYIPAESFIPINLIDLGQSVETVRRIMAEDPYDKHLDSIAEARKNIIEKYNILALINSHINGLQYKTTHNNDTFEINKNKHFDIKSKIFGSIKRTIRDFKKPSLRIIV